MVHVTRNTGIYTMHFNMSQALSKGILGTTVALMTATPITLAQTTEPEEFCLRYPENSSCENYEPSHAAQGESGDLAHRQLIQVQLNSTGPDDEFIWISLQRDEVNLATELTAYHSQRLNSSLNQILGGALGAVAIPMPIEVFQIFYNFQDQRTEYLSFTSDSCQNQPPIANGGGFQQADCAIAGNGTINLPENVDIRAGYFTLGYTENSLIKAIIFRLEDQSSSFVGDLNLDQLCQSFPLNSRCRYWPL
ncbi:hypothetical protein IQ254_23205 [Nodosilinea sp. LEGE 07088]|uniref:hypothetical protein n=1 Tax=Nodosilinea sp. LEGE 07088 TaxID=2777968 RepID=UPI00187F333C|nr:hypothetical protein [Nodosilinea sp. LEGE 07088]MBE9140068.1 hypothetical protein [Nodosilinea sp. LEGE 07088]